MKYKVKFPNRSLEKKFDKTLSKISPVGIQDEIMNAVEGLAENPRPFGKKSFKKLTPPIYFYHFTAQYRIRIGDYRVLYDIDDKQKVVWILHLRRRAEHTYRGD